MPANPQRTSKRIQGNNKEISELKIQKFLRKKKYSLEGNLFVLDSVF